MSKQKYLFIDRDGTLITEPPIDFQVDSVDKLALEPDVIPALLKLQAAGFKLVMITNQDGLGTPSFPMDDFIKPHKLMMDIFTSQGIHFEEVLICPHFASDKCDCRKPNIKLVLSYLTQGQLDVKQSYVIGDRQTDNELAQNMGIQSLSYHPQTLNWLEIAQRLTTPDRYAHIVRKTKETTLDVQVWLDRHGENQINTGIHFFDHMLSQIATHGKFRLHIHAQGDLHVDDHHTIEDTGISLGEALKAALGDKRGIERFSFVLPMDECLAQCALDLSGRPYLNYSADYHYQKVGDMSTEMVAHFFHSLCYSLACTLHISTTGNNDHHRIESLFKVFGRTLGQAIAINGNELPSSKGVL